MFLTVVMGAPLNRSATTSNIRLGWICFQSQNTQEAELLVRCLLSLQLVSSLSPLSNEVFSRVLSWAQT